MKKTREKKLKGSCDHVMKQITNQTKQSRDDEETKRKQDDCRSAGGEGGGEDGVLTYCLSRSFDHRQHISLSRRSTVPTPIRDTSRQPGAHCVSSIYYNKNNFCLSESPSYLAVCGHNLSPGIAIVFSLLSQMPFGKYTITGTCYQNISQTYDMVHTASNGRH